MLTRTNVPAMAPAPFFQMGAFAKTQFRLLIGKRALWVAAFISLLATFAAYTSVSWIQRDSQIPANSAYYMAQFLAPGIGLTCVLCAFFVAAAALEDSRRRVEALVFSRPVASLWYTLSRLGVLVASVLAILAVDMALAIAVQPWLAQSPYPYIPHMVVFWPYIEVYLVMAVPAAFFLVPCAWLLAITTKRLLAAVAPLFIWWAIIFGTPFGLAAALFTGSDVALGVWFDPTGLAYAREVWMQPFAGQPPRINDLIRYGAVPLSSNFIASRLCFVALGALALFVAAWVIERQRRPTR